MKFKHQLVSGKLIRRYKRFLADVELDTGEVVIAHCTNSGSMKTCIEEGAQVYLSPNSDPNRKTKFTWEMIFMNGGWIGINTIIPNALVYNSIVNNEIKEISGFYNVKREVKFGNSRLDIFAENETEKCFIEVKNVSMKVGDFARFPDSITSRGKKHLESLMEAKLKGYRAVMVYVIQRGDIQQFGPAWDIDPEYSKTLLKAVDSGIEVIPIVAKVSPEEIVISHKVPSRINRYFE